MSIDPTPGSDRSESGDSVRNTARNWVVRLALRNVDEAALEALRQWREASPANNLAFEAERRLYRSLGPLEAAFGAPGPEPRPRGRVVAGAIAGAVACVLAWVAADPLTLARADFATGSGEISEVRLPDGSRAVINSESAIDIAYDGGKRTVRLLRGEAWFDVRHDPRHPFVVDADGVTAQALGTAYGVKRTGDGGVALSVTRGAVRFAAPQAGPLVVRGGEAALIDAGGKNVPAVRRPGDALAWRSGRIIIENRSLGEVASELSRYRPGRVVVLGPAASRRVTGVLKVNEVDRGLEGLAAAQGLRITHVTPWLAVLR